jgi:hypothetical protein
VFGGTPPPKPLNCKFGLVIRGALFASRADHTGWKPWVVPAKFELSPTDITWMSRLSCPQVVCLWFHANSVFGFIRENKKPCLHTVSRVKKSQFDSLPAYLQSFQASHGSARGERNAIVLPVTRGRLRGLRYQPTCGRYVHASLHRTDKTSSITEWLQSIN